MIDLHAHHWPAGLLNAVQQHRPWFGWEGVHLADGRRALALGDRLVRFSPPETDLADYTGRTAARAQSHGIIAELTMPVGFLWGEHLGEQAAADFCQELNEETSAVQHAHPDRYRAAAMLPWHAPRRWDDALARAIGLGLGVVAVPTNVRGTNLDHHTVLPLVERALQAGMALLVHPTYLTPAGGNRMQDYYFHNSFGAPLEEAMAVASLVHAGLFDRWPEARVLAVNGAGCLPYEIGRFAGRYAERPDCRTMEQSPEQYLDRVHFDCLVLDDRSLRLLVDRVGARRVVVGTDHPFRTDVEGGAVGWLRRQDWLSRADLDAILFGNALAFLDWKAPTPPVASAPRP